MSPKRSTHLKPASELLNTFIRCVDCDWTLNAPSNGSTSTEHHAKTHHHRVILSQYWRHIYDGRPESEKSPL